MCRLREVSSLPTADLAGQTLLTASPGEAVVLTPTTKARFGSGDFSFEASGHTEVRTVPALCLLRRMVEVCRVYRLDEEMSLSLELIGSAPALASLQNPDLKGTSNLRFSAPWQTERVGNRTWLMLARWLDLAKDTLTISLLCQRCCLYSIEVQPVIRIFGGSVAVVQFL